MTLPALGIPQLCVFSRLIRWYFLGLIILVAELSLPAYAAERYDFSYTFSSGDQFSGSVLGEIDGDLLTHLSSISASYNGIPLRSSGSLHDFTFFPDGGANSYSSVLSFSGLRNNFYFTAVSNYDYGDWIDDGEYFLWDGGIGMRTGEYVGPWAWVDLTYTTRFGESPYDPNTHGITRLPRWSLTGPGAPPVPEPSLWIMFLVGIFGIIFYRRIIYGPTR